MSEFLCVSQDCNYTRQSPYLFWLMLKLNV
uniref:Uncharacterized protein n=1 Tax=Rhizophora mucronata TaxID=61149 RepID=A0A2P2NMR7_RHIMU